MAFLFFKKFFGQDLPQPEVQPEVPGVQPAADARKAECPYCKGVLKKVPGAKTKCPHCDEYMYVRTSPTDNTRKVVTKQEADKIAEDWAIVSGTHDQFLAEKEQVEKERSRLKGQSGMEPSERDVQWGLLNKSLLEHARNGDWGLYRNDRYAMAEILRKEQRLSEALKTYLEVCYIDLNGPNNTGGLDDPELLKEYPPFDPTQFADLAPGVIDIASRLMKKLNLTEEDVRTLFLEHNLRIFNSLKLPKSPQSCWSSVRDELISS